jgi:hypothetical protein
MQKFAAEREDDDAERTLVTSLPSSSAPRDRPPTPAPPAAKASPRQDGAFSREDEGSVIRAEASSRSEYSGPWASLSLLGAAAGLALLAFLRSFPGKRDVRGAGGARGGISGRYYEPVEEQELRQQMPRDSGGY